MGISLNTYVGPYVRCQNATIQVEEKVRACGNKQCPNFGKQVYDGKAKFCKECGSPIEDDVQILTDTDKVHIHELFDHERLTAINTEFGFDGWEDVDVWINNMSTIDVGRNYDPKSESYVVEPTPESITSEIAAFEQAFAQELTTMRQAYGPENVKISWGILGWMS